jgi:hypothetical protein
MFGRSFRIASKGNCIGYINFKYIVQPSAIQGYGQLWYNGGYRDRANVSEELLRSSSSPESTWDKIVILASWWEFKISSDIQFSSEKNLNMCQGTYGLKVSAFLHLIVTWVLSILFCMQRSQKSIYFMYISLCLPPACLLVSFWTYFFNPEDGGDMFLRNVGWQRTTRRHIPDDDTLHNCFYIGSKYPTAEKLQFYTYIPYNEQQMCRAYTDARFGVWKAGSTDKDRRTDRQTHRLVR